MYFLVFVDGRGGLSGLWIGVFGGYGRYIFSRLLGFGVLFSVRNLLFFWSCGGGCVGSCSAYIYPWVGFLLFSYLPTLPTVIGQKAH